jgi:hypothetical protein
MLDMLKDRNLLIGAAIGVGASYAMKGSGKGTLPRAALYGVIGAVAGKTVLPMIMGKPAEPQPTPEQLAQAQKEMDRLSKENLAILDATQKELDKQQTAEGMYVGRLHHRRHS